MHVSSPMHDDIWHSENHQPYLVETGSNVTLTCTAKSPRNFSSEPYEIIWFVNSTQLTEYDCTNRKRSPVVTCYLTLRWPAVGGKYTCQAANSNNMCTIKELELEVAGESRLTQSNNYFYCYYHYYYYYYFYYYYYYYYYYYFYYKRPDVDKFCLYRFTTVARKYHEKACKRSVMRKKKVVMLSVGHRRKKIQVN